MVQTVQKSLVYEGIEEVHLFRSILKYIADHIFQHGLCKVHVILEVSECTLWLDHPELSCMTCGVGVLCTECRSECVYIAECLCKGLAVQLTAYCQVGLLAEEVLGIIDVSLLIGRDVIQIHSRNLEHLSSTLTVASCDKRCVYIDKSSLLEELMDCICTKGTYTEHSLEGICSGTKVCDRS